MPLDKLNDLTPALRVMAKGETHEVMLRRDGRDGHAGSRADTVLERYAVVPSLANPRVLLPLDAGAAALGAAIAQHAAGASSPFVRLPAQGLRLASRLGLAQPLLRGRIAVTTSAPERRETPLHAFLAEALGRKDFVTSMRIAPHRPNGKPVVQAIALDGRVLAYAKFGWETLTRRLIRHEAEVLAGLASTTRGTPLRVPPVLYGGAWGDFEALVVAPLQGHRLSPRSSADIPVEASRAMAALPPHTTERLGESAFWRRLTGEIDKTAPLLGGSDELVLRAAQERLEARWGDVAFPVGRCHGDWIPPNMSAAAPGVFNVWDWELSDSDQPLGIDTLQFVAYLESRRRQSLRRLAESLHHFGRTALARQGLDPERVQPLLMLHLLRMIALYGAARRTGQAKDGDRRYLRILGAVID